MKKHALLLVAATALTLSATSSKAYIYDFWGNVTPIADESIDHPAKSDTAANVDILRAFYASDADNHYFRIDLQSIPSSNVVNYGVVIENSESGTLNYPFSDTGADFLLLRVSVTDLPAGQTSIQDNVSNNDDGSKALEWSISRDTIGDRFDWFAFSYKPTGQVAYDLTEKVTATPIPGAAWLLGSGILALAGIRSKRKGF